MNLSLSCLSLNRAPLTQLGELIRTQRQLGDLADLPSLSVRCLVA